MKLFIVFLMFLSVVTYSLESNAGFRFRITSKGLNYASKTLVDFLRKELIQKQISDARGEHGDFTYEITNIKAEPIAKATTGVELKSNAMKVILSDVELTLSANWKYSFIKNRFIKIRDSGSMTIKGFGISINVEVSFDFDPKTSIPSMKLQSCQADLSDIQFEAHGKSSVLYNTLFSLAREPLKGILKDELCNIVHKAVDTNINDELSDLSMQVSLDSDIFLDYKFVSSPEIRSDWVEFNHAGTVFGGSVARQLLPDGQPSFCEMDNQKMLQGVITEDFLNSYVKALQVNGKMVKRLTRNDLAESEKGIFDTDCKGLLCLVNWITKNAKNIKNATLEVDYAVTSTPIIKILEKNITGNVSSKADIFIRYPNDTVQKIFTIRMNTLVSGVLEMEKGLLRYTLNVYDQKLNVVDDTFGEANAKGTEVVEKMLRKKLLKTFNSKGKVGVPIPDAGRFMWMNTNIQLKPRVLCFNTNLLYEVGN